VTTDGGGAGWTLGAGAGACGAGVGRLIAGAGGAGAGADGGIGRMAGRAGSGAGETGPGRGGTGGLWGELMIRGDGCGAGSRKPGGALGRTTITFGLGFAGGAGAGRTA